MRISANQKGFTYIAVLTVVMIMGIILGMAGQSWKTFKQRELEEELIYRGDQVAEIVYQYMLYKNSNLSQNTNLFMWNINSPQGTILDELVNIKTESYAGKSPKKFRLRASAARDPMTNKPWKILSPVGDDTRFAGVASTSSEEPFRKSFKDIYDSALLDEKKHYSDWSFTWELKKPTPLSQKKSTP